jgi:hypothetical protein
MRRNIRRWMTPERRRVSVSFVPASNRVLYQPLGVVGIIGPWNYPVALALVTLELDGKPPVIIERGSSLGTAGRRVTTASWPMEARRPLHPTMSTHYAQNDIPFGGV